MDDAGETGRIYAKVSTGSGGRPAQVSSESRKSAFSHREIEPWKGVCGVPGLHGDLGEGEGDGDAAQDRQK